MIRPGEGTNVSGIFRVNAALHGMPAGNRLADHIFELFAGGQANLRFDQVNASDHFRDGVLHLYASVHFDEINRTVLIHQKFNRARAAVTDLFERRDNLIAHLRPPPGIDRRRRGFFDELLVAALDAAFAFAQMDDSAMRVPEHLKFDVARTFDEFLEIHVRNAEGLLRLISRRRERRRELFFIADNAHPSAPASRRGLHNHGICDSSRFGQCGCLVRDDSLRSGHHGHSRSRHFAARLVLFPHHAQQVRRGPDEGDLRGLTNLGEVRIFGKKPVTRMDRFDVRDFGRADDLRDVQVTFARSRRPDANGFIGESHVERVPVGFGIDRDRGNAQFLARIDDAQGDFTAIGNEDFSKHFRPVEVKITPTTFSSPRAGAQKAVRHIPPAGHFPPEFAQFAR